MNNRVFYSKRYQKGVVFIISAIMLLVLAALSLTILSSSVSEKIQSGVNQDSSVAKQAANSAITAAKAALLNQWALNQTECTVVPCVVSGMQVWASTTLDGIDITQQDFNWWYDYGTEVPINNVSANPLYIIVDLGCDSVAMVSRYRIVAKGFGVKTETIAYADQTFSVPVNSLNLGNSSSQVLLNGSVDGGVVMNLALTPSQASEFYIDDSGPLCPAGHTAYAQCEVNCGGYFRVMAWSYDQNCGPIYGPWAGVVDSTINLTINGVQHTLSCGP